RQTEHPEERTGLLAEAIPYEGDIDQQYWAHWRAIENDEALIDALGLLARVRGPIPMKWVARRAETVVLRKLQKIFLPSFQQEGDDFWIFFHNSFRLFLVSRTNEPLPGQTPKEQNRTFHRRLADYYEGTPEPWRWEALYHRYCAEDHTAVVRMATQGWF